MSTLTFTLYDSANFILRGTGWEMQLPEWRVVPNGHYWFKARDEDQHEVLLACTRDESGLVFDNSVGANT